MFVWKDHKRKGAYVIGLVNNFADTVCKENRHITAYFGTQRYSDPKAAATKYVKATLIEIYGKQRALKILRYPHLVSRMKLHCGVNAGISIRTSRGTKYPYYRVSWNHIHPCGKRSRVSKGYSLTGQTEYEQYFTGHVASMYASYKRSEIVYSPTHESAFKFEYDLEYAFKNTRLSN